MTHSLRLIASTGLLAAALAAPLPAASHGSEGDHSHGPEPASRVQPAWPQVEAASETFELVAQLRAGELVVLVDRYATNEPVLGATLEVGSGALKAQAVFRPEQGDYLVKDAPLLQALARPGEHPLVFTLRAGADNDLLDATLRQRAAGPDPSVAASARLRGALDRAPAALWGLGAVAVLVAVVLVWRWKRRRSRTRLQGGLR